MSELKFALRFVSHKTGICGRTLARLKALARRTNNIAIAGSTAPAKFAALVFIEVPLVRLAATLGISFRISLFFVAFR